MTWALWLLRHWRTTLACVAIAALCGWWGYTIDLKHRAETAERIIQTKEEVQGYEDAARKATDDALIDLLSSD